MQADGVGGDVTPSRWIVVPEVVVVQPRLRIMVLPRKAQVDGAQLQAGRGIAEGRALPAPDRDAGLVGAQPRGGQVIGMQVGRGLGTEGAVELALCVKIVVPSIGTLQGARS